MLDFKQFLSLIVVESLHPELQDIIRSPKSRTSKQSLLAKRIKELTARGEKTGIEGNMPRGSSRAYLAHAELTPVTIDGKKTTMKTGTKVAIRASLDKYHKSENFDGFSLGSLQNRAENDDPWVNTNYRILIHKGNHQFESNHEDGIFPPLLSHDEDTHEWSHVGHVDKITGSQFKNLTKTESHPKGISHSDFCNVLERFHNRSNGRYHEQSPQWESNLDHIEKHPLVQKFIYYHGNTGHPPHDYRQLANLGQWTHPLTGEKHIVARDHGYDTDVADAYTKARRKQWGYPTR